jgi:hypothetical protein
LVIGIANRWLFDFATYALARAPEGKLDGGEGDEGDQRLGKVLDIWRGAGFIPNRRRCARLTRRDVVERGMRRSSALSMKTKVDRQYESRFLSGESGELYWPLARPEYVSPLKRIRRSLSITVYRTTSVLVRCPTAMYTNPK